MPVPELSKSISKYLSAVQPFLNEIEYENTKKVKLYLRNIIIHKMYA